MQNRANSRWEISLWFLDRLELFVAFITSESRLRVFIARSVAFIIHASIYFDRKGRTFESFLSLPLPTARNLQLDELIIDDNA